MTGSNNLDEAINMQQQLKVMLKSGGFYLRKWCANHPKLLQNIPNEDLEIKLSFNEIDDEHIRTLGLIWQPVTDVFQITVTLKGHAKITKRTVLADMAHIFDPLGLVNPVVVMSKIFLQQLWKRNLSWDEELPVELHSMWQQFRKELCELNNIQIQRFMFGDEPTTNIELHAFSDASEKAYGAVLYLRSVDKSGKINVKLLCSKSKIAPIKSTTLPRLELCAALLTAQLASYVKENIDIKIDDIIYWTDSQIVISWLQGDPAQLKTFVANRVANIQEITQNKKWRYINTKLNPADIISRGMFPQQLKNSKIWFKGPEFLSTSRTKWPNEAVQCVKVPEEERQMKCVLTAVGQNTEDHPIYCINHGNSFGKLQRILAYVLRAVNLFKNKSKLSFNTKQLQVQEIEYAHNTIMKEIQLKAFKEEINHLKQGKHPPRSSKLTTLAPFLDEVEVLRVGGRLEAADIEYTNKHPILVPSDSFVTRLLMSYLHNTHLHAGPQTLLAITRQKYWILQGRNLARATVNNCVICARAKPRLCLQQMGNLPANRVKRARPFVNCGVDFCGPVYTHFKIRGKRPQKTYIAVFCCFATKAIHLEVVSDLSTDGFLGALRRFISRRGKCENIYCDNGRNFVGAKNKLAELQEMFENNYAKNRISNMCLDNKIQFHFTPPRSPHFGGLWEAAVKSSKYLLYRTTANAAVTYEELCTTTAEIEAILNSRPLIPLSADPNDLEALTPAHFLIGEPMTSSINSHPAETKMSLCARWQLVTYLKNEFWRRWYQEYLSELQKRAKWKSEYPNIKEGTIVIIKEDNTPPMKWPLGRIVETIPGADNKVRVADVKTATGIYRRAVHLLAPLPVDLEQNEATSTEERDDQKKTPPKKENFKRTRKRKSQGSSLNAAKVLLLTALVLPLLTHAVPSPSEPIQIQSLNNKAGIYFEKIGKADLTANNWNLLVYHDLKGYFATVTAIEQMLIKLTRLSTLINHNEYHKETVRQYQHQLEEIQNGNLLLRDHTNLHLKTRNKRSPFDIVGTIANKLFGILDTEYAEKISNTIENVKANEDHLLELVKNQTSVLDATINIVKKGEEDRTNQTKRIEEHLEVVYEKLRNMNNESKQQEASQAFNTLLILIASLINECHAMQNAILDVITDTHNGRVNPLIITIKQLKDQIGIIKDNLPRGCQLPIPDGDLNVSLLYRLMTIQYIINKDLIIFNIEIPLTSTTEFEIFRIVSFPTLVNNLFVSITTTTNFLMTNLFRDQFYLLTNIEYTQCVKLAKEYHLCHQNRPTYYRTTKNPYCEIELFVQKPLPSSCAIRIAPPANTWIQLSTPNHWLFALKKPYQITIICKNTILQKTLVGNGLISLTSGCMIKGEDLLINAIRMQTKISNQSFQPTINLTLNLSTENEHNETIYTPLNHVSHKREFDHIKGEIANLKRHQNKLNEIQPHDIHHYTLGYTSVAAIVIISIYLVIRHRRQQIRTLKIRSEIPQPTPRNRSQLHKNDGYNFEVRDSNGGQDVEAKN